jgi:hypothetical protein
VGGPIWLGGVGRGFAGASMEQLQGGGYGDAGAACAQRVGWVRGLGRGAAGRWEEMTVCGRGG